MESIVDDHDILKDFLEEAELQQYFELFRDILKVTKLSQLKFVLIKDLVQIGLSKPEQRRYKKIYSKYFPNTYMSKIKKLLTSNKKNDTLTFGQSSIPIDFNALPEIDIKIPEKHIISYHNIKLNKELGMGQFGVVRQATWKNGNRELEVAIKFLGNERTTSYSEEFFKEAAVMLSIEHPNIIRLYGVIFHLDCLMLVTELAPLRSLLECLREVSLRTNFPVFTLCEFAQQICYGMAYLEDKRLIHRDLAARNILVFSKNRIKISDFGLSRALGAGKDYYQTNFNVNLKLPVAWCAPECIQYLRFTSANDVWAFGVCLWEMFTYGIQPWAAYSGQQILEAIEAPHYQRLERPDCCPYKYYSTMLECWSHDPNNRPKFKDLCRTLRDIQPEQVQTIVAFQKVEDWRRPHFLEFKSGQIITVLGKHVMNTSLWYGVLPGGTCGMFDPNHTKPCVKWGRNASSTTLYPGRGSMRALPSLPSILRSDTKRHTYTGKRNIQRSMISSPQGEVKHTGHVGLDGAYFGDISFLDPAACQQGRHAASPHRPLEDLEQVPLLNPSSPSHLTAAACASYPHPHPNADCDEVDLSYNENKLRSLKKPQFKCVNEPTTSKSILNKVKSATLGRAHKSEDLIMRTDEVHEYHEISDTDTDAADFMRDDQFVLPESPGAAKGYTDFGQSLLDEMESMFRNFDARKSDSSSKHFDNDGAMRSHTLSKGEKKRTFNTGTMKLMSAYDERTLDNAVALANEITARSMNDLEGEKVPSSPSDRSKFHFKFPLVSLHNAAHEGDAANRQERRNFSEEAKSVPDIQSTITEESKLAYTSLIEEPTPCTSMAHAEVARKTALAPAPAPKPRVSAHAHTHFHFHSVVRSSSTDGAASGPLDADDGVNELPLPPKGSKPKLVDKPRHVRKHPLRMPPAEAPPPATGDEIIYQNAAIALEVQGPARPPAHTNPFTSRAVAAAVSTAVSASASAAASDSASAAASAPAPASASANPFNCYMEMAGGRERSPSKDLKKGSLVKDHVSVEDLLEFADQKPCGRQRGVESDEVRIMKKVLKKQVSPEDCLEALELSDWNVHHAIKMIQVMLAIGGDISSLGNCSRELSNAAGDVAKAAAALTTGIPTDAK